MDAQSLRSTIKSARDLMRKDAGLNTDVDRIPQLSWILFLKCFEDFEKKRSALNKKYKKAIPDGYHWSDWAGNKKLTGEDLIKFVNNELFPKLSSLVGGKGFEQRDVIASIFQEMNNRILSGYVLRQIVDLVDQVDFVNSDDIHTMAKLYEDMLIEMRDAAGSNGEFYTPRPVIRFIVEQIKPKLKKSEKILDPACGTGGFLIESLEYMKKNEKSKSDYEKLRYNTLYGTDKKPMPYLLCMMNMLLHEIDKPNITRSNPLARQFREITEKEQYKIIMTNPPFGGEEEEGISSNLPIGFQTSDTAFSFLILIMYTLKLNGRCAIILPNSALSTGNAGAKIRKKLVTEFNLHTIVRLPRGVFSPYTNIATNILFFENTKKTDNIWYYEQPKRKTSNYSKSKPFLFEELEHCSNWWKNKTKNEYAWKVSYEELEKDDFNLDQRNPNDPTEKKIESTTNILKELREDLKTIQRHFEDLNKLIVQQ